MERLLDSDDAETYGRASTYGVETELTNSQINIRVVNATDFLENLDYFPKLNNEFEQIL